MLFLSRAKFFWAVFSIWNSREAQINEKEAMTKFWIRPNWWVQPEEWEVLGGRGAGSSHRHPDHRHRGQESAEHAGGLQEQVGCQVVLQAFFPTQSHTTAFKFCRSAHLLNKLLMSKINLHVSSNFLKLLCIEKRCFQSEKAKSSQFLCFINWAPMLVHITSWTRVQGYQKLHLLALATADKFLIEKYRDK